MQVQLTKFHLTEGGPQKPKIELKIDFKNFGGWPGEEYKRECSPYPYDLQNYTGRLYGWWSIGFANAHSFGERVDEGQDGDNFIFYDLDQFVPDIPAKGGGLLTKQWKRSVKAPNRSAWDQLIFDEDTLMTLTYTPKQK